MLFDGILKVRQGCLLGGSRRKAEAEDALGDCEARVFGKLRFGTHDETIEVKRRSPRLLMFERFNCRKTIL